MSHHFPYQSETISSCNCIFFLGGGCLGNNGSSRDESPCWVAPPNFDELQRGSLDSISGAVKWGDIPLQCQCIKLPSLLLNFEFRSNVVHSLLAIASVEGILILFKALISAKS